MTDNYLIDKSRIKNIIFDLGGVLLHINFQATHQAFEALGIKESAAYISQHHANDLFEKLETGAVSPDLFYKGFREITTRNVSNAQIQAAWNAMLLHFSRENIDWLERIGQKYNTYLFSNTNEIHYDHFMALFEKEFGGRSLDSYFKNAWYSHQKGIRKPYPSAFKTLLAAENLKADETLFIDDTTGNIEGAREAGLHALLLKNPEDLHLLDL